jgi:hypothetical protein
MMMAIIVLIVDEEDVKNEIKTNKRKTKDQHEDDTFRHSEFP